MNRPIPFHPDIEDVKPDEEKTVEELNEAFDTILEKTSEDYGHAVRSVHAKSHGILEGTLIVEDDLPEELAQGLFAKPGRHRVFMRFSTNAGDILPDAVSLPRGLAMKVLDVDGERLPDAEGTAQDFIMVNGKVFQAKTAKDFLKNLKLIAKTTDRMEGTKVAMSTVLRKVNSALETVGIHSTKIASIGGAPNSHPLGQTYFSVSPFRYGDYIAKFSLAPISADLLALTETEIDASGKPDAVRDAMRDSMAQADGIWEFCVQLCRDIEKQPVEDPTVEWDEEHSPFIRVAILRASSQDSWDEKRVDDVNERMRFSVWTGIEAHRPLGNINRSRKRTYKHSADFREAFNRCPIHEPQGPMKGGSAASEP
jgi:hypothetical protein